MTEKKGFVKVSGNSVRSRSTGKNGYIMPYAEKMLSSSLRRAAAASCKLRYCCPNSSQLSVIADADDALCILVVTGTPARMYSVGDFITARRFGL